MLIRNSLINYIDLYMHLYNDVVGAYASVRTIECRRDKETILRRYNAEGIGFLTKTLPKLGKAVDKALSTGAKLQFSSFHKKKGTELPILYWWLFSLVFDSTGRERSDACPWALVRLRQLLLVFYKLELPYDEREQEKVLANFISTDAALSFEESRLDADEARIAQHAKAIASRVVSGICLWDIIPRHGPGAVATGEKASEKRDFKRIIRKLDRRYPLTEYFFYNLSHVCDRLDTIQVMEVVEEGTAKVVLVPKDSRGPRLISCEPLENQWIQQGQMSAIVEHLESIYPTKGHINFTSQDVNRQLALESSITGDWSTLDMKDASDRVGLELVRYLFPSHFVELLEASRSTCTVLPDGTVVRLKKFAPMGSAICFPLEALVFWAISVAVLMYIRKLPFCQAVERVYVYGDDLIVRSEDQAAIRQYLPSFDLLVNEDKCCTHGSFRESCGCDAYKGVDVTPLKIKKVWGHPRDAGAYASWVSYSNSLWKRGYLNSATYLEDLIQKIRRTPFANSEPSSGICFVRDHVDLPTISKKFGIRRRFNKKLQRTEFFGWRIEAYNECTPKDDWEEMLRISSTRRIKPNSREDDELRLEPDPPGSLMRPCIYAFPRRNRLKRGWFEEY